MTERAPSQVQATKMGFLRKVCDVALRDEVRSSESCKSSNVELSLRKCRDLSHDGSAVCGECSRKEWRAGNVTPREKRPRVRPRARLYMTSRTWVGPVLLWSKRSYQSLLKTVRDFEEGKRVWKLMKWKECFTYCEGSTAFTWNQEYVWNEKCFRVSAATWTVTPQSVDMSELF